MCIVVSSFSFKVVLIMLCLSFKVTCVNMLNCRWVLPTVYLSLCTLAACPGHHKEDRDPCWSWWVPWSQWPWETRSEGPHQGVCHQQTTTQDSWEEEGCTDNSHWRAVQVPRYRLLVLVVVSYNTLHCSLNCDLPYIPLFTHPNQIVAGLALRLTVYGLGFSLQ